MLMLWHSFIVIACFSLFACTGSEQEMQVSDAEIKWVNESAGKTLEKNEYKSWISSKANPTFFQKKIAGTEFELRYLPSEYLALREAGKNSNDSVISAAKTHYEDLVYFQFRISIPGISYEPLKHELPAGAEKIEEYNRRVKYCAFGIQRDLSLITEKSDTIPCAITMYERSFDVAPILNFQIAFDKNQILDKAGNISFSYQDNLFNRGIIKFTFRKEDLEKVPKLGTA